MGNSQSADFRAPAHLRTGKPKSNSSTADLGAKEDWHSMPSSPVKTDGPGGRVVTYWAGVGNRGMETRRHIRSEIFGQCPGDYPLSEKTQINAPEDIEELAVSVREALSRSGSILSMRTSSKGHAGNVKSNSPASSQTELTKLDLPIIIHILQELQKTASPDDLVALHRALLPTRKPTLVDQARPQRRLPREAAQGIRRSAVFPPGFATRGDGDLLRKRESVLNHETLEWTAPKSLDDQRWKPEMISPSPLEALSALDFPKTLGDVDKRASTPVDRAYAHLGTLKIGSLRIMNGASSPEPSSTPKVRPVDRSTEMRLPVDEDYYTASEGRASPERPSTSDSAVPVASKPTSAEEQALEPRTNETETRWPMLHPRFGPPRKQNLPQQQQHQPELRVDDQQKKATRAHQRNEVKLQKPTPFYASAYLAELPSIPFTPEFPFMQSPMTSTPKMNRIVSLNLPAELPAHNEKIKATSGLGFDFQIQDNHDNDAIEPQPLPSIKCNEEEGNDGIAFWRRRYSQIAADEEKSRLRTPRTSAKTDSGYSSDFSLQASPAAETEKGVAKKDVEVNVQDKNSQSLGVHVRPLSEPPRSSNEDQKDAGINAEALRTPKRPSPFSRFSTKSLGKKSTDGTPNSSAEPSPSQNPNSPEKNDTRRSPNKLKKRQKSHTVITSALLKEVISAKAQEVPVVPDELVTNHTKRLAQNPAMQALRQTHESSDSSNGESDSIFDITIKFPSPNSTPPESPTTCGDVGKLAKRLSWHRPRSRSPEREEEKRKTERSKSRSRSRARSKTCKEGTEIYAVEDFGTVALYVGRSPYDVALGERSLPASHSGSSLKASQPVTQPYQIGSALPRPKVTMDEKTASEFARNKSMDLHTSKPQRRARSKSQGSCESPKVLVFGSSKRLNPSTVHGDRPPVPECVWIPKPRDSRSKSPATSEKRPKTPSSAASLPKNPGLQETRSRSKSPATSDKRPKSQSSLPPRPGTPGPKERLTRQLHSYNRLSHHGEPMPKLANPSPEHRDPVPNTADPFPERAAVEAAKQLPIVTLKKRTEPIVPPEQSLRQSPPPRSPLRTRPNPPARPMSQDGHMEERARSEPPHGDMVHEGVKVLDWEAQAQLWRQRRKSIAEGLALKQIRVQVSVEQPVPPLPSFIGQSPPTRHERQRTPDDVLQEPTTPHSPERLHPDLVSRFSSPSKSPSASTTSLLTPGSADIISGLSARPQLFSRYSGGYEFIVDGSAGTDSAGRRSPDRRVSNGFSARTGIDLGDVPLMFGGRP